MARKVPRKHLGQLRREQEAQPEQECQAQMAREQQQQKGQGHEGEYAPVELLSRGARISASRRNTRIAIGATAAFALAIVVFVVMKGSTTLHQAAVNGDTWAIRILLMRGADVNARENVRMYFIAGQPLFTSPAGAGATSSTSKEPLLLYSWTPLHFAAIQGEAGVAKLLLANDADVDAWTDDGLMPLHCLSDMGQPTEVARLLLEYGAEANAHSLRGLMRTPLHFAAKWNNIQVAQLLLDHKADVNAKDNAGRTPLDIAVREGHTTIVELLRRHRHAH